MNLQFLIEPFAWLLQQLYLVTGNIGWSIIAFTIIVRVLLLPFTLPALKSQKKLRELQPHLRRLQQQHKGNKEAMAKAQMELYKQHNFNPLGGCLPSLAQFIPLIIIYQVLQRFIASGVNGGLGTTVFLGFNLVQRDTSFILPIVAGVTQLVLSLMISPAKQPDVIPDTSKNASTRNLNKKESDQGEMMDSMQKQMIFMAPVMTGLFAINFPSGLSLYWIASTVISIIQQYFVTGWGGLAGVLERIPGLKQPMRKELKSEVNALATALAEKSEDLKALGKALQKVEKKKGTKKSGKKKLRHQK